MTMDTWITAAMALVSTVGGVAAARSARRTKAQERRDDFVAVTRQMRGTIQRLERRMEVREAEAEEQRQRIRQQDVAIGWLVNRVRGLTSYIRKSGLEPPAGEPIPPEAREYLHFLES